MFCNIKMSTATVVLDLVTAGVPPAVIEAMTGVSVPEPPASAADIAKRLVATAILTATGAYGVV